jgi:flagellar hook-length control protein FliK
MTLNKEISTNFSLLMTAMPQATSLQFSAKQKPAKDSSQPVGNDFSERLSAALDESAGRLETAGKATGKKNLEKAADSSAETGAGLVPYGMAPVGTEPNTQTAASETDSLVDLKNAALQGLAASAAAVMPAIVQTVAPAVLNSQMLATLAGGSTTENVDQMLLQVENLLQQSRAAGSNPTGNVAAELQTQQPITEFAANPPTVISAFNKETQAIAAVMSEKEPSKIMANVNGTDTSIVAETQPLTQIPQGKPVDFQQTPQSSVDVDSASPVQQQIQHDMLTARVSTVISNPTVPVKQPNDPIPVQEVQTVESEDSKPSINKAEPSLETVVTPTKEQELPKQSMSHSDTNTEAGLSEKSDASLSVPVGFDKVMTTVNEPATVIPPVAQPRPDLHEVVKQVMDGMISPSQQLKSSQVIITLKPEHLGEVTVKINVDGDKVTAAFHAASTEVRGILESSLPQLRQEMSQQGWQFDSDGVFGGMQEFLGQQEQQQAQQQQMRSMINHARPDEYDDALAFSSNGKLQVMSATAVDYRI